MTGDRGHRSDGTDDRRIHVHAVSTQFGEGIRDHDWELQPTKHVRINPLGVLDEVIEEDHPDLGSGELVEEPSDLRHIVRDLEETRHPHKPRNHLALAAPPVGLLGAQLGFEVALAGHTIGELLPIQRLHHLDRLPKHHDDPGGGVETGDPGGRLVRRHVQRGAFAKPSAPHSRPELFPIILLRHRGKTEVRTELVLFLVLGHEHVRMFRQRVVEGRRPGLRDTDDEQIGKGRPLSSRGIVHNATPFLV
jgi:hypothetical protein